MQKLAFVLLEKTSPYSGYGVILGILFLVFFCYMIFFRKRSSKNDDSLKENILSDSYDDGKEAEVLIVTYDPNEYVVDENDSHLFYQKNHKELSVRIISSAKGSKDVMTFATSLPFEFDKIDEKILKACVPQLTSAEFEEKTNAHSLKLHKSAAAKWEDIQDNILKFLFTELDKTHAWKFEKQIVILDNQDHYINVVLRSETRYHLDLGRKLHQLKGIGTDFISTLEREYPLCMEHAGRYSFSLHKFQSFSWEELYPRIEKIFMEHYSNNVEFIYKWRKPQPVSDTWDEDYDPGI